MKYSTNHGKSNVSNTQNKKQRSNAQVLFNFRQSEDSFYKNIAEADEPSIGIFQQKNIRVFIKSYPSDFY